MPGGGFSESLFFEKNDRAISLINSKFAVDSESLDRFSPNSTFMELSMNLCFFDPEAMLNQQFSQIRVSNFKFFSRRIQVFLSLQLSAKTESHLSVQVLKPRFDLCGVSKHRKP